MDINFENKARLAKVSCLVGGLAGFHVADMFGMIDLLLPGALVGAVVGYAAPLVKVEAGFAVLLVSCFLILKNCNDAPGGMRAAPETHDRKYDSPPKLE
ncbi:MAG TPA: hypothetical protein DIT13_06555 [Verrucomicrobiales bacterium]|nr:hypothetical protein [Verrucomicrobiales bacterium]HRJ09220.1 hypothetical protein [Prosthecobacter sp.]HRK13118.1 hypothetical protein [Prosthecobacter sp.]